MSRLLLMLDPCQTCGHVALAQVRASVQPQMVVHDEMTDM